MSGRNSSGGGLLGRAAAFLLLFMVGTYALNVAYEWLLPLIPAFITGAIVLLGLSGMLALVARHHSR